MNIVVPMAGHGKRFKDAGFDKPKPFIDVLGYPMIVYALKHLSFLEQHSLILLCLEDFLDKYGNKFTSLLEEITRKYTIIPVKEVTQGAACTVLLAKDYINNDEELVITDCDHINQDYEYNINGYNFFRRHKADGGIFCFWNDNPKWSYLRISSGKVIEVVEKQVVSNIANTGEYYFRKGSDFVKAAEYMVNNNIRTNGEVYIAPAYNQMIIDGKIVLPYFTNDFVGLGTPEDLQKHLDSYKR